MDRAYTNYNWNGFEFYNPDLKPFWINKFISRLLQNTSYRTYFINTLCDYANSIFLPENVISVIDSMAALIKPEITRESERWGSDLDSWQNNVNYLRAFAEKRPGIVRQQMAEYFNFSPAVQITVDADSNRGKVLVNSVSPNTYPWKGYYFPEVKIKIEALAAEGFHFSGWSDSSLPKESQIEIAPSDGYSVSPIFSKNSGGVLNIVGPSRTVKGRLTPLIIRAKDVDGEIDHNISQTVLFSSESSAISEDIIKLKKGAGTFAFYSNDTSDFSYKISNDNFGDFEKVIKNENNYPSESYLGELPEGEITWSAKKDRLITGDLTIPKGTDLTITEGTQIVLNRRVNIFVYGSLTIAGTENDPVIFAPKNNWEYWGGIELYNTNADFRFTFFVGGGGDRSKGWAHSSVQPVVFAKEDTDLKLDNCFILYSPGKAIGSEYSKVNVSNCITAFIHHGGEYLYTILNYKDSYIMNIPNDDHIFEDKDSDAFHIDYLYPGYTGYSVLENSFFITGKDDAVDHNSARLIVKNCYIDDWMHEGVASSGGDTIKVFNTLVKNCEQGIEAGFTDPVNESGPFVFVDHCTVIENDIGLRFGDGYARSTYSGHMTVSNSVLYNNGDNILNYLNSTGLPKEGVIDISFSMTNDENYDSSLNCITGIPEFDHNFFLLPFASGIGLGMNGTNMGLVDTLAFDTGSLVITEIMYNNHPDIASKDWIEVYNPQSTILNISNWKLKSHSDDQRYVIPDLVTIPPKSYIVLCEDTTAFRRYYPGVKNYSGNIQFGFNINDRVEILSGIEQHVDSVKYYNTLPWPEKSNGQGFSLALKSFNLDNTISENWISSMQMGGTPGVSNTNNSVHIDPQKLIPAKFKVFQNYPNPFNNKTNFHFDLNKPGKITIAIFNILGQKVKDISKNRYYNAGRYSVQFDSHSLSSGVYFYKVKFESVNGSNSSKINKMVLLK